MYTYMYVCVCIHTHIHTHEDDADLIVVASEVFDDNLELVADVQLVRVK